MSFRNKFLSILTIALGIVVFSAFAMAQDTTTVTPTAPKKVDKPNKGVDHGFGPRKFGREGEGFAGKHGGPGARGGNVMAMLRGVNLTDAQKTQIHSILETNKPDQATMETARTLRQAKQDGTITAEQRAQLKALREQQQEKAKSVHEQILAVLTPEQKQAIEQRRQEMKQRFEQHRQGRPQSPASPDKPKTIT